MSKFSYSVQERKSIDQPFNYVLPGLASLMFWIAGYVESIGYPVYGSVSSTALWDMVCRFLPGKGITYLIGILLLSGGAFLIHRANYMLIIIREKTYLPLLFYITFISSNIVFFPLSSASLGMFCLIIAYYQILSSYNDINEHNISVTKPYNAILLIGVGSLLWIHLIWFIPVFWLGLYMFRSLNMRTFLASIFGLVTVYWFLTGLAVLFKNYDIFIIPVSSMFKFTLPNPADIRIIDVLYIACLLFPSLLSIINIIIHEYEDSIRTRQFLYFTMSFGIVSLFLSAVCEQQSEEFLQVSCIPMSILSAHFFSTSKLKRIYWVYYIFIIVFILLAVMRSPWSFLPADVIE